MIKSLFLLILAVGFTNSSFGQLHVIVDSIAYNFMSRYDNGQIKELGNYTSNRKKTKNGYWLIFDQNGKILEKGTFKKNKKVGRWSEYEAENSYNWTGTYERGKKNGVWYNGINCFVIYKKGHKKGSKWVRWL